MLVDTHKPRYAAATRYKKTQVAVEVVNLWKAQNPQGRFLAVSDKNCDMWMEIEQQAAVQKTAQALRERPPKAKFVGIPASNTTTNQPAQAVPPVRLAVGVATGIPQGGLRALPLGTQQPGFIRPLTGSQQQQNKSCTIPVPPPTQSQPQLDNLVRQAEQQVQQAQLQIQQQALALEMLRQAQQAPQQYQPLLQGTQMQQARQIMQAQTLLLQQQSMPVSVPVSVPSQQTQSLAAQPLKQGAVEEQPTQKRQEGAAQPQEETSNLLQKNLKLFNASNELGISLGSSPGLKIPKSVSTDAASQEQPTSEPSENGKSETESEERNSTPTATKLARYALSNSSASASNGSNSDGSATGTKTSSHGGSLKLFSQGSIESFSDSTRSDKSSSGSDSGGGGRDWASTTRKGDSQRKRKRKSGESEVAVRATQLSSLTPGRGG